MSGTIVALFLTVFSLLQVVSAAPFGQPFAQPSSVHVTAVYVDLEVPQVPSGFTSNDAVFVWAGVQPGTGADPSKIGNGILTPSLTYGPSCAPGGSTSKSSWWISGSYFNVPASTSDSRYAGCHGGNTMAVEPGERISCSVVNTGGSTWVQTCSRPSGQSVSYTLDMNGQEQNWAQLTVFLSSDNVSRLWSFPVYIYNYRFTTSAAMSSEHCVIPSSGKGYIARGSTLSGDGRTCSLDAIALWNSDISAKPVTSI